MPFDAETQSLFITLDEQVKKEVLLQIQIMEKGIDTQVARYVDDVQDFVTQRPNMTKSVITSQLNTLQKNDTSIYAALRSGLTEKIEFTTTMINEDTFFGDLKDEFQLDNKSLMTWQAVFVNTCPDCQALHGSTRTRAQWEAYGFPKEAPTVCTTHCQCTLIPVTDSPEHNELQKPIKVQSKRLRKAEKKRGKKYAPSTFTSKVGQLNSPKNPVKDLRKIKKVKT